MPRGYPKKRERDWAPRTGHYGEQSAVALWTDKKACTIREYRAEGFSYDDLQKLFGGSMTALRDLCHGRTYKTAGGPIAGIDYPKGKYGRSLIK